MIYLIKNIRQFMTEHRFFFFLFVLCQVVSVIVLLFSYGIFQNFNIVKKEAIVMEQSVSISFDKNGEEKLGKIKQAIANISKNYLKETSFFFISIFNQEKNIMIHTKYNDEFIWEPEVAYNVEEQLESGRVFTESEYRNGDKVVIVSKNLATSDTIEILGEEYKIIGIFEEDSPSNMVDISYNAPNDNLEASYISINYDKLPSRAHYLHVKDAFESVFGDRVTFPEFETADVEERYYYNTVMIISVVVALLCAINFSVLYKYILTKRRKTLAIFRMSGCTTRKARRLYIAEIMVISIPLFALCTILYDRLMLPRLGKIFEYLVPAYSSVVYLTLFAIYTFIIYIVLNTMISRYISRTPVNLLKAGEK